MARKKQETNPQLRKDPAFLKMVGKALQEELTSASPTARKEALLRELAELLPQLDEEGLQFLLDQGRIHLYNMKVAELQALAEEIPEGTETGVPKKGRKELSSPKQEKRNIQSGPVFQIKAGSGGGSYHVMYQGKWKVFSDTEMLQMVRIVSGSSRETCQAPSPENARRLYQWLRQERADVFQDIPFQGPSDPLLIEFVSLLQKTFRIRTQ